MGRGKIMINGVEYGGADIAEELSSESTNTEAAGAKATYDELKSIKNDLDNKVTSSQFSTALQTKVSVVEGKGLSTNDFTDEYKEKVDTNETNIGTLTDLKTTEKTSLVGAINEHNDELNILNNSQDFNVLLEHANTFAISTRAGDMVTCGGSGGTFTSEKHKIIVMYAIDSSIDHMYSDSFILISKTKDELMYTKMETGHDDLTIKEFTTTKGNKIYVARLSETRVIPNWNPNPKRFPVNVYINNHAQTLKYPIITNMVNFNSLPKCVMDLSDFILYSNENIASGVYPQTDKYSETIGSLSSLTTTDKSSLVGAVNEVRNKYSETIGSLSSLTTTDKSSLVGAVNEVRNEAVKISSGNSRSITTLSESGYMTGGTIEYVKINGFCTVFFDKFHCLNASGSLGGVSLVNSSLPKPVTGFKINDEITVNSSGKLIGGDNAGGSITFTGTVTYPLYSSL